MDVPTWTIWLLFAAPPLIVAAGMWKYRAQPALRERRDTRLAVRAVEAHERGDLATYDQLSAQARDERVKRATAHGDHLDDIDG